MYEIFEELLTQKGVTAYKVAKETGLTTATLTNWKKGRYTPKQDKLQKIADYFGVTIDYLMNGNQPKKKSDTKLAEKDIKDVKKHLDATINLLKGSGGLMFDGDFMDDEAREKLANSLELVALGAKKEAKEKFTPKKYRK